MKYFGMTDTGRIRKSNQDNYTIVTNNDGDVFAVVCDGIGGGNAGDVASGLAVSLLSENFANTKQFQTVAEIKTWIMHCVTQINQMIFQKGQEDAQLKGMGTTMSGVLICKLGSIVINIGDSRVYTYKNAGTLKQVTIDHTLMQDMIMHGELSLEDAKDFPKKNVLTNALGVWENIKCDIDVHLEKVDGFMICSDGLHGYVEHQAMENLIVDESLPPSAKVKKLIRLALNAGGFDNVTVILIDLQGENNHE